MMPEPTAAPPIAEHWLAHVPLSWHRVSKVVRDEHGVVARDDHGHVVLDGLTDSPRALPVGWIDHDTDGLVWVLA